MCGRRAAVAGVLSFSGRNFTDPLKPPVATSAVKHKKWIQQTLRRGCGGTETTASQLRRLPFNSEYCPESRKITSLVHRYSGGGQGTARRGGLSAAEGRSSGRAWSRGGREWGWAVGLEPGAAAERVGGRWPSCPAPRWVTALGVGGRVTSGGLAPFPPAPGPAVPAAAPQPLPEPRSSVSTWGSAAPRPPRCTSPGTPTPVPTALVSPWPPCVPLWPRCDSPEPLAVSPQPPGGIPVCPALAPVPVPAAPPWHWHMGGP